MRKIRRFAEWVAKFARIPWNSVSNSRNRMNYSLFNSFFSINSLVDLLQARGPQLVYDPVRLHARPLEDVGLGVLQGREHLLGVELPLALDLDLASLSLSSCLATLS